ncbi:MAG: glycosyltransferase [Thermoanaerobaculales bacterium]|jgi:glycosyltransferase involved in cell wall biosynthesis|nr:glycosyltransferase [Thermoanaerobaculales bacterium]
MVDVTCADAPTISLVIPARNEAALLPRLLDTVDVARSRYRGGAAAVEVIVADNGSTDATPEIAARRGCRVVEVVRRCIGAVRNDGAGAASGAVLAFVDADIRIHPDTFDAVAASLATGRVVGGATGVRLERWSLGIAATYAAMVPFVWLTGMDTGVVFCPRADFEAVGGYDESLRAGEDVRLLVDLKRLGRRDGRRLVRLRPVKAVASMRKFDAHGDWHYFTLMPRIALGALFGSRRADELVDAYWYRARG